jgi:PAS domain S-box-containing protein
MMNYQDKTKDELIKELHKLQQEYDSLKTSYLKDIDECKQTEKALKTSEEHYRTLLNSIDEGFCIVEVIFDEDERPVDYRFLETNASFDTQTGLIGALGKRMRELKPEHEEHWFEIYGKIALTGQPARFENLASQLNRWYDVYAFRYGQPENRQVAIIFNDITQRKQAEEAMIQRNIALSKLNQFAVVLSDLSPDDNFEAIITRHVKEIAGADVAIFSEYNSKNKTTSTRHIEIESAVLKKVVRLLGTQVKNIHSVVSDEMYREMTTELIGIRKTLFEVSFGAISKPVGAAIQALLKVDRFIGLAYLLEEELYGTSVLAMSRNQPDPPREILENFINLASIALRRRKSDEKLVQSDESLRKAQKVARMGSWKWDIRNNKLEWSDEMFRIFGIDKEYFSGDLAKVISDSIHPDDRNAVEKSNLSVLKHKKPIPLEYRIVLPNGTERVVWAEGGDLILDNKGNPESLSGIVQDITERKQAEELLKISEIKYRTTLESINEAFFTLDNELRFTYFNKQAEVILLKISSDVLGKQIFSEVFPEAKGSVFEEKYRYALTAKKISTFETFFGIEPYVNWYDVRVYPGTDGISVFFTIITDRKKAEKELQKRINDLEEFHSLVIDREFKMIELKKEINELAKIAGKPERYEIAR